MVGKREQGTGNKEILDFRFSIGVEKNNPKSKIQNPKLHHQSPVPSPQSPVPSPRSLIHD
ncbi:hypothetical protein H6F47_01625 [Sphaerospermopsis sp. FACHB-1094]|uniref:hypothetical protein n=1 Tax=Sphaerospermopsis sp. FACHB-1094 TaxID=2692861 RepID=UPI0016835D58|nr:hypothetical protein [Sphaerospermopsis sp. FACHB-1094]MBD2131192.1 hypothetical protein [Sphaerospermopsis sp. FACHB-1094]